MHSSNAPHDHLATSRSLALNDQRVVSVLFLPLFLALAILWLSPAVAHGEGWADRIQLNGFGNWFAAWSDGPNQYSGATPDGTYDNIEAILSLRIELAEDFHAVVQPFVGKHQGLDEEGETEVELELAFLSWQVTDHQRLRLGRLRLPFGYYTEVFDSGVSRPFFNLPQSIYGPAHFVSESIDGGGFNGHFDLGSTWSLTYDLYAGSIDFDLLETHECALDDGICELESTLDDVVGGRLFFESGGGLGVGLGIYRGKSSEPGEEEEDTRTSYGAFLAYTGDRIWLRAELARGEGDLEGESSTGAYLEAAYFVTEKIQLAARWESLEDDIEPEEELELAPFGSLLDHGEVALGVNYWPRPNIVFKLSYHQVDDNHLAVAEDFLEAASAGELVLDDRTEVIAFAASYSF